MNIPFCYINGRTIAIVYGRKNYLQAEVTEIRKKLLF